MSERDLLFAGTVFFGFLAIMNPIANTPIFLVITQPFDERRKKLVAAQSVLTALVIVAVFTIAGTLIFQLFGITLPAFRITGGILVFFIGLHMLQGKQSKVQAADSTGADDATATRLAVSPLGVPILASIGTHMVILGVRGAASSAQ